MVALKDALSARLAQGSIVAAAADVFARLGFGAARVEDILDAAGVARRTFYRHFGGKDEVLSALYDFATKQLLEAVTRGAVGSGDAFAAIRRALDVYLDYHVENGPLLKVLVEEAIRGDSPLAPARRRFREDLVAVIGGAAHAQTGEALDPMVYVALVSALEGVSLELLTAGASAADVKRAKQALHLVLDRVLALPGPPRP